MKNKFIKAFTLSELLITIGVVGTVAILTIPNIVKNIYTTSYMKKVETAHKTMAEAIEKMKVSERLVDITESTLYKNKRDFFTNYLKTSKVCGTTSGECFGAGYGFKNGKIYDVTSLFNATNKYYVILPNKASVAVLSGGAIPEGQILFMLDGNGKMQPNKLGEDTMLFFVKSNGATGPLLDEFDYDIEEEPDIPVSPDETNQSCKDNTNYTTIVNVTQPIDCRTIGSSSNSDYKYCGDANNGEASSNLENDYWAAGKKQCDNMGMVMLPADAASKIAGLSTKNSEGKDVPVFTSTYSHIVLGTTTSSDSEQHDPRRIAAVQTGYSVSTNCPYTENKECTRILMPDGSGYLISRVYLRLKSEPLGAVCGCKSKYGG